MSDADAITLKRVRLHLARSKAFPDGSAAYGYEFVAPLDEKGHIDLAAWRETRGKCIVERFWGAEGSMEGFLVHKAGGAKGATWVFDYDKGDVDDDEAGYRFGDHAFTPGEYVSLKEEDGEMRTFRVFSVEPE